MTWVAAGGDSGLLEKTHLTFEGSEWVGPAYWWFRLRGAINMEDKCMPWPPYHTPTRVKYDAFAISNAALLGAEFQWTNEDGWTIKNHVMMLGRHAYQSEAASAFLAHKGFWCALNKDDEWELVRI